MASMIHEGTLTNDQIDQIVAYLKTLQPEQGCPVITGINEDKVHRLADDTAPAQTADESTSDAAYNVETRNKS